MSRSIGLAWVAVFVSMFVTLTWIVAAVIGLWFGRSERREGDAALRQIPAKWL